MIGFLIFNFKRCPKIRSSSPIFFLPRNLQETTSKEKKTREENERFQKWF